jgi:hypothetical protein
MERGVDAVAIDIVNVALALSAGELESFTVKPTEKLPLAVGVPARVPPLTLTPAGSAPLLTDQI